MVPAASFPRIYDDGPAGTLLDYNLLLSDCLSFELNEEFIEAKIDELDEIGGSGIIYQLTLARITELTLICAGNYADNLEFSAAGDLLVNPRRIHVHINGAKDPVQKNRHSGLTLQFGAEADTRAETIQRLIRTAHLETIRKPLLPCLYERLEGFGTISADYVHSVSRRMEKIAEVIGFLSAGRPPDPRIFYDPPPYTSKSDQDFIRENLCCFKSDMFFELGDDVLRMIEDGQCRSRFIR